MFNSNHFVTNVTMISLIIDQLLALLYESSDFILFFSAILLK